MKSGAGTPSTGANSTISKPTKVFSSITLLTNVITSYEYNPPGSGVPVDGIIEGSKTSKSIVKQTSSPNWSSTSSIQFEVELMRYISKKLSSFTNGNSTESILRIPT